MRELLDYSIRQIDNLYSYYQVQQKNVMTYLVQNVNKFKYGVILNRFFMNQIDPKKTGPLSENEKNIIADMIEDFDVVKAEAEDTYRVSYKLRDDFKVEDQYELDPNRAREEFISLMQQPVILSESVLMMLLIKYEDSISRVFRYLIGKYPQAFLSDKSITYSELLNLNSNISEIKEMFIAKEIDSIMREPISDWYESLEKRQKAHFLFADHLFEKFKEVYYRRNLVVHNQGVVNETYLRNVKGSTLKIGDNVDVDQDYLENAFALTRLMLIDTYFGLRKVADDAAEITAWISSYGYNCLVEKKWSQAKYIFSVLLQDDKMQSIDQLIAKVNYWIAVKNLNGIDAIQQEVKNLDTSAMQLQFSVAKAALLDENDKLTDLLDECLKTNEIPAYYIKTWPLLNEFRNSEYYDTFVDKHRENMNIGEYETPSSNDALLLSESEKDSNELLEDEETMAK